MMVEYDGILLYSKDSCNLRYEGEVEVEMMDQVEAGRVSHPADRDGVVVHGTGRHGHGRARDSLDAGDETGEYCGGECVTL